MIEDLAAQLIAARAGRDPAVRAGHAADPAALAHWAGLLMADEALLGHCHALAAESLIAGRLQHRQALDPVLSPLLQELIASADPAVAGLAMQALAAQSRFVQSQRRMELPLAELPAELLHAALALARGGAGGEGAAVLARLQTEYDEAASRLGVLARLVAAMRRGALAALALDHAGLALFASALAAVTETGRGVVVLACHEGQGARLALLLRAADLPLPAIERQVLLIEPAGRLPRAIAGVSPERAAALLTSGRAG